MSGSAELWMRYAAAVVLIVVAAVCIFGFLASGEPGVGAGWRIGYAGAAAACGAGAVWLAWPRRRGR